MSVLNPAKHQKHRQEIIHQAEELLNNNIAIIPLRSGKDSKIPCDKAWRKKAYQVNDLLKIFPLTEERNLAILLGEDGHGIIDIDLDDSITRKLSKRFLPHTDMAWGRKSSPLSHMVYRCKKYKEVIRLTMPSGEVLVEIRGTKGQTMVPPSKHPEGEQLEWCGGSFKSPAVVEYDVLYKAVYKLAAAALIIKIYPSQGGRNNFILPLSGALARSGFSLDDAKEFLEIILNEVGDTELDQRITTLESTYDKFEQGGEVTGITKLGQLVSDEKIAHKLREFLCTSVGTNDSSESSSSTSKGKKLKKAEEAEQEIKGAINQLWWDTRTDQAFATVIVRGDALHLPLLSDKFKDFFHYAASGYNSSSIKEAVEHMKGKARFVAPRYQSFHRINGDQSKFLVNLGNSLLAEVSPHGWKLVSADASVKSIPYKNDLPKPSQKGNLKLLKQYVSLENPDDFIAYVAFLCTCFIPHNIAGSFPVLVVNGSQGVGKTTFVRNTLKLANPQNIQVNQMSKKVEDLYSTLNNNHVVAFDNISNLTEEQSNILCQASTGSQYTKRALYSNNDIFTINFHNPLILNGISNFLSKGDLIDRSIALSLEKPKTNLLPADLNERFLKDYPEILGGILNALSTFLSQFSKLKSSKKSHRIVVLDMMTEVLAKDLGVSKKKAKLTLKQNQLGMRSYFFHSSTLCRVLSEFLQTQSSNNYTFTGSASQLFNLLNNYSSSNARGANWPDTPQKLGKELAELEPLLKDHSISFTKKKVQGNKVYELKYVGNKLP